MAYVLLCMASCQLIGELSIGVNGKPCFSKDFEQNYLSISHTDNMVAVAISDQNIGIDVEQYNKANYETIAMVCSKKEQYQMKENSKLSTLFWTAKESLSKLLNEDWYSSPMTNLLYDGHDIIDNSNPSVHYFEVYFFRRKIFMNNLVIFLTYTFLTAFTPGPNNILVISNTSKYGLKKSSRLLQGIFLGLLFVMIFCSAFSIMLVNIMPTIKPAMTYIGAGYIFWIAWNIVKSKSQSDTKNVDKADGFMTGFLLQFVNIKIILYGITAISNFIIPHYNSPISIGGFTLLITSFGCVGTFTWAIFGVVFQSFFKKYNSIINIIMALLLAYCAISLII